MLPSGELAYQHIPYQGTFEDDDFPFPFGGIWIRSQEGSLLECVQESYNTHLEHTPGNPTSQL